MHGDMVAHACNPTFWKAEAGRSPEVRSLRPAWPTWQNPVSTKNKKISWAWQCMLVVPATQETEAGESLEPRRRRLQWAKIMPLHSSLGDRVRLCLNEEKRENWDLEVMVSQVKNLNPVSFTLCLILHLLLHSHHSKLSTNNCRRQVVEIEKSLKN